MEKIILSHFSAFAVLRYARAHSDKICRCKKAIQKSTYVNLDNLKTLHDVISRISKQQFKLDVILNSTSKKIKCEFAKFHYVKNTLIPTQFYTIQTDDLYLQKLLFDKIIISSAELSFLQLSRHLPQSRLMLLGMELCGSYALDFTNENGFVSNIEPVTNIDLLKEKLKNKNNLYMGNSIVARQVCKYLANNSASPAESYLYLLLCGPRKFGYFQVKKLNLNQKIHLSKEASLLCGFSNIRPDMCSTVHKIAIEYDSRSFHYEIEKNQNDKSRLNALVHDGWHVISIVPQTLNSYQTIYTVAKDIMKLMNQDPRIKSKNFAQKSIAAYNEISLLKYNNFLLWQKTRDK